MMKFHIVLVAEIKEEESQTLSQRTWLLEWLRSFVINTLGLNIVRLEVRPAETKGENDGSE